MADQIMKSKLRDKLVETALEWQDKFGVAPSITSALSELDAALQIGMSEKQYGEFMQTRSAVSKDYDFEFKGKAYQVKGSRPSGKKNSRVTRVSEARKYEWNYLIWVLYDKEYVVQEMWRWNADEYRKEFHNKKRLSPEDMRRGKRLYRAPKAHLTPKTI